MKEWYAVWGAGTKCKLLIENYPELHIDFVIDTDANKKGTCYCGLVVKMPTEISNWKEGYIIVSNSDYVSVCEYLSGEGLKEDIDYCNYLTYLSNRTRLKDFIEVLQDEVYGKDEPQYLMLSNREEYERVINQNRMQYENVLSTIVYNSIGKTGSIEGYCDFCKKESYFQFVWHEKFPFDGREHLRCVKCQCNPRMRYLSKLVMDKCTPDKNVYIYEQITNTYKKLKEKIPNLQGSEYLGADKEKGKTYEITIKGKEYKDVRHEDALELSFEDESKDMMLSLDVFEHVSDYKQAFKEAYRVLKKGGSLMFSIPIQIDLNRTIIRARIEDGKVVHLEEPEYHGNPLDEGSLAFFTYGWDIVDFLKEVGYSKIVIHVAHDERKGYFGYSPYFEAVK